ncbi:MAG: aminopeptidase P family protein [Deltaproteobacteria bacterium]|nr:MAG: aminopeptidase P family protein [Deltaproteobacteria bacterium]
MSVINDTYKGQLVPAFEINHRINRLRNEMQQHRFEAVLIIHRPNYFYFSGTSQSSILYLPLANDPVLFVRRDMDRARKESPLSSILPYWSPKQLPNLINEHAGGTPGVVGIELDVLPARDFFLFKEIFGTVEFVNSSPAIMRCRMKKTTFEIEQIRKAAQIAKEVFEEGRNILRPGMSEIEFGASLELEAKKRGHEGLIRMRGLNSEGYSWHILSGPNGSIVSEADTPSGGSGLSPAFPMGAGWRKIQSNEPILVDFPVCYNGYLSDQARMYCIGELPEKFVKAYEFCREVEARILKEAHPGIKCEEVFSVAERMARDQGYEDGFLGLPGKKAKFVGHGVGLEANELPVLAAGQTYPLGAGVTVAIEPKVVFPQEGVVGIENMYLITNEGHEKLTFIDEDVFLV